jgi:hypothetical protein
MSRRPARYLLAVPALLLLCAALSFLPPVRTRLELWYADVQYRLNPPQEMVFVPQEQQNLIDLYVSATLEALQPTLTPTPSPTGTAAPAGPTPTPTDTPAPTLTPTPLPAAAQITGVDYQNQHGLWNYCGPANLAMAVSFWGWQADRVDTGTWLRGGDPKARVDDKNVMPYEMANYVNTQTNLRMIVRAGGTLDLLKAFIAAGYPILLEKEDYVNNVGWLGHYLMLVGYDDAQAEFTSMDTYHGAGTVYSYEEIHEAWRAFNFTFLLAYPPGQEQEVQRLLGPYADDAWATQHALERALAETGTLTGLAEFYAWFNVGTSYVNQFDYGPASAAYDKAFALYANMPAADRPWRMMWYQTGPYFAYYYSGRYQDVLTLADTTLNAMTKPILEESFYWRGLAKEALGDIAGAIADLQTAVALNPNFGPGWSELQRMQGGN